MCWRSTSKFKNTVGEKKPSWYSCWGTLSHTTSIQFWWCVSLRWHGNGVSCLRWNFDQYHRPLNKRHLTLTAGVCVFITLPVAARGWNSYYINTVKPPLPVFYLIEDILWRLYGNDRTCTVFLFYSDFVCVAEINPNLSPRLGMRMQERGKLPYKFIPGCREQRREWWCCD